MVNVTHNYPNNDNLLAVDIKGNRVSNALVEIVHTVKKYTAGITHTDLLGEWEDIIELDDGQPWVVRITFPGSSLPNRLCEITT